MKGGMIMYAYTKKYTLWDSVLWIELLRNKETLKRALVMNKMPSIENKSIIEPAVLSRQVMIFLRGKGGHSDNDKVKIEGIYAELEKYAIRVISYAYFLISNEVLWSAQKPNCLIALRCF